jgi:hypothetical protein
MGIYVDYTLRAECGEEELRDRLERVRRRCLDLPLQSVGDVQRVEPIYSFLTFMLLQSQGYVLPDVIAARLKEAERDPDHGLRCLSFGILAHPELPKRERDRYFAPVRALTEQTDLWKKEELPEEVGQSTPFGFSPITIYRAGIEFEFASILLRYGYLLILHPGEGSEAVCLGLSTFRRPEGRRYRKPPLWYGQSFTKTQYAKKFVQVHETVCRVLDIVQEEGLLLMGRDNCGYYASRSWKDASKRVNEELAFARLIGGMMGLAIGNMREEGVPVQVIEDNASKATLVDFSAALAREREEAEASETQRKQEDG